MAPQFGIDTFIAPDHVKIGGRCYPWEVAVTRLLAEVCSATTRWIAYGPKRNCEQCLLGLSDDQVRRIAQRHEIWKADGG